MTKTEKAVTWAIEIANDPAHGYDQDNRWGPDYDCSSLVISAWQQAGVPVKTKGAFHVKNIIEDTQTALRSADNVLKINRVIQSKDVHVLEVTASRQ